MLMRLNPRPFSLAYLIGPLGLLLLTLLASGCAMQRDRLETKLGYERLHDNLRAEDAKIRELREKERLFEQQNATQPKVAIEPVLPTFNPLEEVPVSINVQNETLHNVLFVIARNAGLNLVIEPGISLDNRVTISFERAPSAQVIEKLLAAYDLAWKVSDNILSVQRFTETIFTLDFLNVKTEAHLDNGGDIYGSSLNNSPGSLSGNFRVSSTMGKGAEDQSLYAQLLQGIRAILSDQTPGSSEPSSGQGGQTSGQTGQTAAAASLSNGSLALDPLSGTLIVRTSPTRMQSVKQMVANLRKKMSRQVVIDARILEVRLKDEFRMGIDWNYITSRVFEGKTFDINFSWAGLNVDPSIGTLTNPVSIVSPATGNIQRSTFTSTIEALQTFGGVKVLSNPHVRARHGQPALFTSGTSQNYVRSITRDEDTEDNSVTFEVEVAQVFDGIMLGVVPFVLDDSVDLQIFPIKSEVEQASLALVDVTGAGGRISLPKIDIKNVSTAVRVRDNDTVILGGLIDKSNNKSDKAVPGVGAVPLLGWAFNSRDDAEQVRELVIVMNIRIVQ